MGKCIDKDYVCDGDNDCQNNYDEENCPEFTCSTGQFKCSLDRRCINSTKGCDGTYDCPSLTDEQNCRFNPRSTQNCGANQFQCTQTSSSSATSRSSVFSRRPVSCVPQSWICDGHVDCADGSDEPSTCVPKECRLGYFKCGNSKCIPDIWRCGKFNLDWIVNCKKNKKTFAE